MKVLLASFQVLHAYVYFCHDVLIKTTKLPLLLCFVPITSSNLRDAAAWYSP
jgi:hypothetical protein